MIFLTLHHQKSTVYKAPLEHSVVNWKNSVFSYLYIQYFHFTEEIDYMLPISLWPASLAWPDLSSMQGIIAFSINTLCRREVWPCGQLP